MHRPWLAVLAVLAAAALAVAASLVGCGRAPSTVIRVSAIPDMNRSLVAATTEKLCAWLEAQTGLPVRFEPSNDYTAAVNGLLAGKLDLVWYGGVTAVEVEAAAEGAAEFVATRDVDLEFRTYFIANRAAVAEGRVRPVETLEELAPLLGELTLTFGDKKSTSGHIMPRHFLLQAGIDPERDPERPAAYRASGGHSATLQAVASGEVDLGALNYMTWDQADEETRRRAPVIYTTPRYVDYAWVAHRRLGEDTVARLRAAFVALDRGDPDQRAILDAWGAGRFVAADPAAWDGVRAVLSGLPKDFLR